MNKSLSYLFYNLIALAYTFSLQGSIVRTELLEKTQANGSKQRIGIFHEVHAHLPYVDDQQAEALLSNFESLTAQEKLLALEGVFSNNKNGFTAKQGLSIQQTFGQLITSLCLKADELYGKRVSLTTQRALKAAEALCDSDSITNKIDNNLLLVKLSSLINNSTIINIDEARLYLNFLPIMLTFKDIFEISKALGNENLAEHKDAQEIIESFNIFIEDFLDKIAHMFERFEHFSLTCYERLSNRENQQTCKNLLDAFRYASNEDLKTHLVQRKLSYKYKSRKLLDEAFYINTAYSSDLSKDQQIFNTFARSLLQLIDETAGSGGLLSWMLELNALMQIYADNAPSTIWLIVGRGHADNLSEILKREGYERIYDSFVSVKIEDSDTSEFITIDPDEVEHKSNYAVPLTVEHFTRITKSTKSCKKFYAQNRDQVSDIADILDDKDEL